MPFFKTANLIFRLLWAFSKYTWTEMLPDEPNCTSNKFSVGKGAHPRRWRTSVPNPSVIFTYSLCDKNKIWQLITAKICTCNDKDNDNDKDNGNDYHSDYDTDNDNDDNDSDSHNHNDNDYDNDNEMTMTMTMTIKW